MSFDFPGVLPAPEQNALVLSPSPGRWRLSGALPFWLSALAALARPARGIPLSHSSAGALADKWVKLQVLIDHHPSSEPFLTSTRPGATWLWFFWGWVWWWESWVLSCSLGCLSAFFHGAVPCCIGFPLL